MQLLICLCVEGWEIFLKVVGDAARTESADPRKLVEIIQSGEQRLGAAHRESGDDSGAARSLRGKERHIRPALCCESATLCFLIANLAPELQLSGNFR
jgi:hypothetical protein